MRRRPLVVFTTALFIAFASDLALTACRSPTEITVAVTTDFDCADLHDVTVSAGTLGDELETQPPTSTSTACVNGRAGTLVVLPSGSADAVVGLKIVGGFGIKHAEDCAPKPGSSPPDYGAGCIVARRALKYLTHTPLTVPVVLRAACNGIPCGATETCINGTCGPATLDPGTCTSAGGCGECTLLDGGCPPAPVYNSLTDATNWATFDPTAVDPNAHDFAGGSFDGRYVYFAPFTSTASPPAVDSVVTRYDTRAEFGAAGSWSTFDTTTVLATARGFEGSVFDGRYVYFVPNDDTFGNGGTVVRYDAQAAFGTVASWSSFDMKTVNAGAIGYSGATFDGRYLYFVPYTFGAASVAMRYDTTAPFAAGASWSSFDTTLASAGAKGFSGGVFDGRYVYLAAQSNSSPDGVVPRFDTTVSFTAASSWSVFDTTTLAPKAKFFDGAGFDGRFVYFVPAGQGGSTVARYDSFAAFGAAASWSTFDTTGVTAGANGFAGAGFDGRFMYFVPYFDGQFDGTVVRYDTEASFGVTASWSSFDMTTLTNGSGGFHGAVFDGRYLYFVPNGHVVRFDAKSPASMPPGYSGSFF